MKILITGAAGFIGFHAVKKFILNGYEVIGLDNINNYYDVNLKFSRLLELGISKKNISNDVLIQSERLNKFKFIKTDIENFSELVRLFENEKFDIVLHLAAQAGVRHSIDYPEIYVQSNLVGFFNVLEISRKYKIKHLIYASSSSVYGLNEMMPFSENNPTNHPISLYAATKKSNELMAHAYSHLYNLPTTGLRFFTVYGPWGRPDMAYFSFAKSIIKDETIKVYNYGKMKRDFTFIDDIVNGIYNVCFSPPKSNILWNPKEPSPSSSSCPYKVYNIGNNQPVSLLHFIQTLSKALGKEANMQLEPIQPGDVMETWASIEELNRDFKYKPDTTIEFGLSKFANWFLEYYQDN